LLGGAIDAVAGDKAVRLYAAMARAQACQWFVLM